MEEREATLGLIRLDNGDGTWSYLAQPVPPADQTLGAVTLMYDGQEAFADEPAPNTGTVTWTEPDYVLTGVEYDPFAYLDVRMVDEYGQRWILADVDPDLLYLLTDDDEADVSDTPGIEWNPDAGVEHEVELTSWTGVTCSGVTTFFQNDQNGDMVKQSSVAAMSGTERKAVIVRTVTSATEEITCSGTLVQADSQPRDDVVLTAAHCITDAYGDAFPSADITVCTMENLDLNTVAANMPGCFEVRTTAVPAGWTGSNPLHLELDYGLVFLKRATNVGAMQITALSDGQAATFSDHHFGYPTHNLDCTENALVVDCGRTDNRFPAMEIYTATGTVASFGAAVGRWDTSITRGTSGGAHYLCLAGDCAIFPRISGVQAGIQNMCGGVLPCATGWAVGPKASAFRNVIDGWLLSEPARCPALGLEEAHFVANPPAAPAAFSPALYSPTCQNPALPGFGTSICKDVQVYKPPAALGCTAQSKLVLYLPGTFWGPEDNDFPMELAAYAGYRVIGLSNANHWDTADWCTDLPELTATPANPDGNLETVSCHYAVMNDSVATYEDECQYFLRRERITGVDDPRSSYDPMLPYSTPDQRNGYDYLDGFPVEDSVLYRLLDTLIRLRQGDANNNCRWGDFYDPIPLDGPGDPILNAGVGTTESAMDLIHWDEIIVAGWSQGGGNAVWLNFTQTLGGLFLLDTASDMCLTIPTVPTSGVGASYYTELVDDVYEPSGETPRFGIYHVSSAAPPGAIQGTTGRGAARPVAWDNDFPTHLNPVRGLRMPICEDQDWDLTVAASEPGGTTGIPRLKRSPFPAVPPQVPISHYIPPFTELSLFTNQPFAGLCGAHETVALSHRLAGAATSPNCMPSTAGGPAMTPEVTIVFEAYVQGFCALGEE